MFSSHFSSCNLSFLPVPGREIASRPPMQLPSPSPPPPPLHLRLTPHFHPSPSCLVGAEVQTGKLFGCNCVFDYTIIQCPLYQQPKTPVFLVFNVYESAERGRRLMCPSLVYPLKINFPYLIHEIELDCGL